MAVLKHVWTGIEFTPTEIIDTYWGSKIYRADPKVGRHGNFNDKDSIPVDDPYHEFIFNLKISMLDCDENFCYYGYHKITNKPVAICGQSDMINRGFSQVNCELANPDYKFIGYGQLDE